MTKDWFINSYIFEHPFNCFVAGPSQSGKTHLIYNILNNIDQIIDKNINKIIFCYSVWQPFYDKIISQIKNIEFFEGIYNFDELDSSQNNLVILDDLYKECQDNIMIQNLFTVNSHHKNISVFLLSQNLFPQGKCSRTISLNSHYLLIFKNPRDKSQIYALARQMFPNNINFFFEAYLDAVENKSHGYLFLDLKQSTIEKNRVQTGILPNDLRIIYTAK